MKPATEKSKDVCQTYLDRKRCEQLKWPWKRTRLARSCCTAGLRAYYKTIVNETAWHWLNTSKSHEFKSEPEHSHTQRWWLIFICVHSCVCRCMHVWVPRDQRLTSGIASPAPDSFFLETQTYWLASDSQRSTSLSLPSQLELQRSHQYIWLLYMGSGDQIQILLVVEQALDEPQPHGWLTFDKVTKAVWWSQDAWVSLCTKNKPRMVVCSVYKANAKWGVDLCTCKT